MRAGHRGAHAAGAAAREVQSCLRGHACPASTTCSIPGRNRCARRAAKPCLLAPGGWCTRNVLRLRAAVGRKARQAGSACVRRRSCRAEATREFANAADRRLDFVQTGGPAALAQAPAVWNTGQRRHRSAPAPGSRQLTASACCSRGQHSCTPASRSNEARSGQQRLPKSRNHSRRLALHAPTQRADLRVRGWAALAACVCACASGTAGPPTARP